LSLILVVRNLIITFEDRNTLESGAMVHQDLTDTRTWILPDRSGYLGVGDTTFSELLKVRLVL